jgi:competence protein ComEA
MGSRACGCLLLPVGGREKKEVRERSVTMKQLFTILGILTWLASVGSPAIYSEQKPRSKAVASTELRVDLNTATQEELAKLPGIGDKVAARIIAYREENGVFESAEEIMNVRGIGEKTFLKLRDNLYVEERSKKGKAKRK